MRKLTDKEIDALGEIIRERLAGGIEDLADALGISELEAEKLKLCAERAMKKLIDSKKAALRG